MNSGRMHSPLGQVRGLGSAKKGVEHWWVQRLTAMALAPLMLWLSVALIGGVGSSYTTVVTWLKVPLTTTLMALLLIALFYHMALGLQVIIEDYVHSDRAKIPALILVRLSCFALAVAGIVAILRIAFAR